MSCYLLICASLCSYFNCYFYSFALSSLILVIYHFSSLVFILSLFLTVHCHFLAPHFRLWHTSVSYNITLFIHLFHTSNVCFGKQPLFYSTILLCFKVYGNITCLISSLTFCLLSQKRWRCETLKSFLNYIARTDSCRCKGDINVWPLNQPWRYNILDILNGSF